MPAPYVLRMVGNCYLENLAGHVCIHSHGEQGPRQRRRFLGTRTVDDPWQGALDETTRQVTSAPPAAARSKSKSREENFLWWIGFFPLATLDANIIVYAFTELFSNPFFPNNGTRTVQ